MGIVCGVVKIGSKLGCIEITDTIANVAGFTDIGVAFAVGAGLETKVILDTIEEKKSESVAT